MANSNLGIDFDNCMIQNVHINKPAVYRSVQNLCTKKITNREIQVAWLLRAVTCIDLTTLSGDDCYSNVERLCFKASTPLRENLLQQFGIGLEEFHVGAVCVYPSRVAECLEVLTRLGRDDTIPIASVAAGFPTGQYPLASRLQEIKYAVDSGASEIDIVINRTLVLDGKYEELYKEVKQMKEACGPKAHLKTILSTGELASLTNVYKVSMVCMMAGADFIKTSTGKESVNATLPVGMVMCRAIKDYHNATGFEVGFKPAGGIRSAKDALLWQTLMNEELGTKWLFPSLFRIGASGLLGDIEKQLFNYVTGYYPSSQPFSFV